MNERYYEEAWRQSMRVKLDFNNMMSDQLGKGRLVPYPIGIQALHHRAQGAAVVLGQTVGVFVQDAGGRKFAPGGPAATFGLLLQERPAPLPACDAAC